MDTPSPGTRVRAKLKNFLNSKMTKARGADLSDSPSGAGFPPPGPEGDSPAVDALHAELAEEKRKRALIAREAAETEEVVRNALTAANARVEDVEARRLELSAELRAAQAASQIFEKERFGIMKKLEDSRVEKSSLEQRVEELTRQVENLERERESKGGGGREAPAEETEGEDDARRLDMLSKLASSPASSDAAIRALTAEKDELAALLETEKQKKGEILEKLESFEEKMVEVQKEKQEIEDRKNEILAKLESFEEKMAEMQRERDGEGDLENGVDNDEEEDIRVATLTEEKEELAALLVVERDRAEAEKQKKSEILAKLEAFEEKMVDVQREKNEQAALLETEKQKKSDILAKLEEFEEKMAEMQRERDDAGNAAAEADAALTAEKDELASELEAEKQKKSEILAKLEEFEEKMAEMQRERDDAGNAAAEADAALTAEKDELASELEAEKQKKSEILAKLEEFEEKMVDVQREKQEIEDRKNEILARLESFEEEVGAVQRDKVGQLETSLADERAKSESLQKSIVDLADEMASLNEAFTKLERERDAHARRAEDEGVTEQSKIKVDLDVERKTNEDLKKELRDCLAGKQKLEEENQDRKDEIAVLEKLLQAERAAAASNASRKKKGLFGRK